MRSVKFWRVAVKQLSLTERMFFRDAIKTLMAWQMLKEEYLELDLIMRILESEIKIIPLEPKVGSSQSYVSEFNGRLLS